ncbi:MULTISPECIES: hypothetical protein [unclassified Halomonas]|uniref:hypothetical protein n=1 Tax=unclassified Halomonas TaxID=2609666 RepID=UPI0009ECDC19|nr:MULTISPECIES: hypothetical protein [unclassified Halomonas]MBT2787642.1 hypothetical protein [Halomonas sp. ISL-106]MBT2798975.1 hypothetical protein [Halomonas sp. ISL-104]
MQTSSGYKITKCKENKNWHYSIVAVVFMMIATTTAEANGSFSTNLEEGSRVAQYAAQVDNSVLQGNVSIIQQQGYNNQANVTQSRSSRYQFANFSHINQRGNNNQANITQSNGNNVGVIWQVGNDNAANISQQGNNSSFRADIHQLGISGDISISQSGSGQRSISVEQQNYSGNARPVAIDTY